MKTKWETAPISATCELMEDGSEHRCGKPTCYCYPASGGGWMSLCHDHGQKHLPNIRHITDLILAGEKLSEKD
jgi:hypothetical protein